MYYKCIIIVLDKEVKMIYIRIDSDLKAKLQEEAEEKGLSLSAYVRMILIERGK